MQLNTFTTGCSIFTDVTYVTFIDVAYAIFIVSQWDVYSVVKTNIKNVYDLVLSCSRFINERNLLIDHLLYILYSAYCTCTISTSYAEKCSCSIVTGCTIVIHCTIDVPLQQKCVIHALPILQMIRRLNQHLLLESRVAESIKTKLSW